MSKMQSRPSHPQLIIVPSGGYASQPTSICLAACLWLSTPPLGPPAPRRISCTCQRQQSGGGSRDGIICTIRGARRASQLPPSVLVDVTSSARRHVRLRPTPHLGLGHVQLLLNGLQLPPLHLQLKCLRSGQGRGGVLSHEYEQKICDSGSPSPLPSAPCVRMCRPGHSACGSCPAGGRSQRGPAGCGVPHAGMVRHGWNWVTALLPHRLLATSTCSHCTCTTQSQSKLHMAAMRQVTCMHLGVEG